MDQLFICIHCYEPVRSSVGPNGGFIRLSNHDLETAASSLGYERFWQTRHTDRAWELVQFCAVHGACEPAEQLNTWSIEQFTTPEGIRAVTGQLESKTWTPLVEHPVCVAARASVAWLREPGH